jgi:hypothetical protein
MRDKGKKFGWLDEDRVGRFGRWSGACFVVDFASGLVAGLIGLGLILGPG